MSTAIAVLLGLVIVIAVFLVERAIRSLVALVTALFKS